MLPDLCPQCEKCRRIVSGKGSLFFLCEVSLVDSRFPKYPRQPVTRCPQFVPLPASVPADAPAVDSAGHVIGATERSVPDRVSHGATGSRIGT